MTKRLLIHLCTKDRPTEVALLLQSLRTQTFQDFNILLLEDGSSTPLQSFYFIQYIIQRLKLEGHNVIMLRNEIASGVSEARQTLVDYHLKNCKELLSARLDDDVILEPDYLEKLISVIDNGYDIASGVTTPFVGPDMKRSIKNVEPIIGYCKLDENGKLIFMGDDCGIGYVEDKILISPHFRSCAIIKREVFEKDVNYKSRLSKNGFLEEAIFSFKAILAGFKIGVRTGANALHLMTPSGGERNTMNMTGFNKQVFEDTVKRMWEDNGDFISDYYKRNGVEPRELDKDEYLKMTNLVKI
jgi:GT2 family glycosyltransferase